MDTDTVVQVPETNSPMPSEEEPRIRVLKGVAVLGLSFAALEIAAAISTQAGGGKYPTAFYLACVCQLLGVASILSSYYVRQGGDINLRKILEEVGTRFAITSFFFCFSLMLPSFIWVQAIYWVVCLGMTMIIIYGYYKGFNAAV